MTHKVCYPLLLLLILLGCNKLTTDSDSTPQSPITISGTVTNQFNSGIAGITVRLGNNNNFTATTDENGSYNISVSEDSLSQMNIHDLNEIGDSLFFLLNDVIVSISELENYLDVVKNILLVQRDISGNLVEGKNSAIPRTQSVEIVVMSSGNIVHKQNAWLDTSSLYFSGFIYTPNSTVEKKYEVFVNSFDKDGTLIGTSKSKTFNQLAGDIDLGYFNSASKYTDILIRNKFSSTDSLLTLELVFIDSIENSVTHKDTFSYSYFDEYGPFSDWEIVTYHDDWYSKNTLLFINSFDTSGNLIFISDTIIADTIEYQLYLYDLDFSRNQSGCIPHL